MSRTERIYCDICHEEIGINGLSKAAQMLYATVGGVQFTIEVIVSDLRPYSSQSNTRPDLCANDLNRILEEMRCS